MTMGDVLRRTAARVPDKTALIMGEDSLTYRQLNRRVNRLANALLGLSLKKGDRVAVLTHNGIPYYECYLALCKSGGVMVPYNNLLRDRELARDLAYIRPRFIICASEFAPRVAKLMADQPSLEKAICIGSGAEPGMLDYESFLAGASEEEPRAKVGGDDLMSSFLTSGTTGKPKRAMRTHHHNCLNALAGATEMALLPDDRVLLLFPFYHVTFEDRFCHLMRGNTVIIKREGNFVASEVLELLSRHRVTICQFVPTMLNSLLQEPDIDRHDLSALRLLLYAAAPMPVELLKVALNRFRCGFMQFYGQTETGPMTTVLRPEDHQLEGPGMERLASCGRPALDFEVRVVDPQDKEVLRGQVGELTVRSEAATIGYWELPEETDRLLAGGWLHTGDFARQDADGFVYIVDRKNDMIISGGKNIYPREVEEVIYAHPAVLEVSVIGVPDPHWGESVKAVVVLKQGLTASAEEIVAHCKEQMASYKKPKTVEFREALPKSPTGKILKRVLRDEFWQNRERNV